MYRGFRPGDANSVRRERQRHRPERLKNALEPPANELVSDAQSPHPSSAALQMQRDTLPLLTPPREVADKSSLAPRGLAKAHMATNSLPTQQLRVQLFFELFSPFKSSIENVVRSEKRKITNGRPIARVLSCVVRATCGHLLVIMHCQTFVAT